MIFLSGNSPITIQKSFKAAAGLFVLFLLLFSPYLFGSTDMAARFQARIYKSDKYSTLPYRLLAPKNIVTSKHYPLILFLHGSDERGTDNIRQLYVGLNILSDEKTMDRYPCFIAAPQCPVDMKWVDVDWKAESHIMKNKPTPAMAMALELIQALEHEFPIDHERIYVIGYSMGGFGTWEATQRRPDLFAAAVPVCGGGDETKVSLITRVPVWAFHGALDTTVKVSRSRNMINALIKAGGVPNYTEYPDINHF
jgi:predicted peptidase